MHLYSCDHFSVGFRVSSIRFDKVTAPLVPKTEHAGIGFGSGQFVAPVVPRPERLEGGCCQPKVSGSQAAHRLNAAGRMMPRKTSLQSMHSDPAG